MWFNNEILDVKREEQKGPVLLQDAGFKALSTVASLCSRAKFLANQEEIPIAQR
jgi:hypothetical protein